MQIIKKSSAKTGKQFGLVSIALFLLAEFCVGQAAGPFSNWTEAEGIR
jgi:hypothetical protein